MNALLAFFWLAAAPAPEAVIAVFEIEDATGRLTPVELDQLTTYLTASLAKTKVYEVVPRSNLRDALRAQQAESFKACYDEACQIELGRELAAQKALVTRIVQVGSACAVTATLIDLTRATSERAATFKADCSADAVVDGLESMVQQLTERTAPPPPPAVVAPAPLPPPPGRMLLTSEPTGATVRIDGQAVGQTPLELPLPGLAMRQVELSLPGHSPYATGVRSGPREEYRVHGVLVPTALQAEILEGNESRNSTARWLALGAVAATVGGGVLFAVAPSERDIRESEYDAYLGSRFDPALYSPVEDRVATHNRLTVGGLGLVTLGAAAAVGAVVLWLSEDEIQESSGTVEVAPL
jgi:hypothetical protein